MPQGDTPEPTHVVSERMVGWYRVLRIVFGKAENGSPVEVMGKVYRLADRIAARLSEEAATRTPINDLAGAVREPAAVIAWCDGPARDAT